MDISNTHRRNEGNDGIIPQADTPMVHFKMARVDVVQPTATPPRMPAQGCDYHYHIKGPPQPGSQRKDQQEIEKENKWK